MLISSLSQAFDSILLVCFFSSLVWGKCGDLLNYLSMNVWNAFDSNSEVDIYFMEDEKYSFSIFQTVPKRNAFYPSGNT